MEAGTLDFAGIDGGVDLRATLSSGQTYCWRRSRGRLYGSDSDGTGTGSNGTSTGTGSDEEDWYHTVLPATVTETNQPAVLRVCEREGGLAWEASIDRGGAHLRRLLRLGDDLPAIVEKTADEPLVRRAYDAYRGMRLVQDPPFPSLVSFICSAQMQVARIHAMQVELSQSLGNQVTLDGDTYHAFPTPGQLAAASESALRDLGLGYRAPYVKETAEMVAADEHPDDARHLPYESAREHLTRFVGVGQKVADCVCLFSLGHLQAVPLDTWIRSTIAEYYPSCDRGSYAETSRAIRERFGGEYAGYAQTYVFHYLRTRRGTVGTT